MVKETITFHCNILRTVYEKPVAKRTGLMRNDKIAKPLQQHFLILSSLACANSSVRKAPRRRGRRDLHAALQRMCGDMLCNRSLEGNSWSTSSSSSSSHCSIGHTSRRCRIIALGHRKGAVTAYGLKTSVAFSGLGSTPPITHSLPHMLLLL